MIFMLVIRRFILQRLLIKMLSIRSSESLPLQYQLIISFNGSLTASKVSCLEVPKLLLSALLLLLTTVFSLLNCLQPRPRDTRLTSHKGTSFLLNQSSMSNQTHKKLHSRSRMATSCLRCYPKPRPN